MEMGGHCQSLGLMIGANTRTQRYTLTYLHTMACTHTQTQPTQNQMLSEAVRLAGQMRTY